MKALPLAAGKKASFIARLSAQKYLLMMSVPFVIWLIIFAYIPLAGWVIAFQDYKPQFGLFDQKWAGLKQFAELFKAPMFYRALRNTLGMSILGLIINFSAAIVFALLLNELRILPFKRITQTISYLPHFVSWVIVATIVINLLAITGPVNELLVNLGILETPYNFMVKPKLFWWIVVLADCWKETGWGAIIYLAAITGIDSQIYEAADIDGAGRLQKVFRITIPCIRPTMIILLILGIGSLINIGFERQLLLGNSLVTDRSLVLDQYSLNYGIGLFRYSYGTAIGIFKSLVSILMVFGANSLARKAGEGLI
jgi:putative aldouronate transport system permease protein